MTQFEKIKIIMNLRDKSCLIYIDRKVIKFLCGYEGRIRGQGLSGGESDI